MACTSPWCGVAALFSFRAFVCRTRLFRARDSPPRGPLVIRLTREIHARPRCRNGRTTFTRRNWPSKRNATTVSRDISLFPAGRGAGGGRDLAGSANRETDLRAAARLLRVNGLLALLSSPSPRTRYASTGPESPLGSADSFFVGKPTK